MSVQITKDVLRDFLSNKDADVLALTGAWGTGKTYAWREALMAHKDSVQFTHYCYVSLFGINSMAELRMALFTKSIAVATLGRKLDFGTINEHWSSLTRDWLKGQYARFAPMLKSLPHGSSVSLGLEALAPSAVHDTLVCIDDLERTKIKPEDILGFITELSEERSCKVALIFNAEKLADKDAYRAYREKAVDFEIHYAPTVQEAFDVVFDPNDTYRHLVYRHVADLEITNVRILRKLRQLVERITATTSGMHPKVVEASIATTVLLCWCAYAPDSSKPKIEDIEKWNKDLISFMKEAERDPITVAWVKRLKAYGFTHVDDFDLAIARVVERGYLEGTGFVDVAKKTDEELRRTEVSVPFTATWQRFHNSFVGDQELFITDLHSSATSALAEISVGDLNGTVRLLRELRRDDLADDLIGKYVDTNMAKPATFDLTGHPFGGTIDDGKLRATFATVQSTLTQLPSLEEAVSFMAKNSGYNPEHIEAMRKASVDDYYALFMGDHRDPTLSALIKWTLRWVDTEHAEIAAKAKEALERIKATSLLNSIRVSRYGI
ncbi:hypothetical protein SAMN05216345_102606 [Cupriavidus sp. YR651]|uniref:hypothetical protein n=1 Tax=Cupriavidus sp. YR651 TaxID=1855315 RepID=UPI00088327AE|nr:hypothetical protein [Cupriavidus sp. YR651]SDC52184.1 hypothetical protein SAMN05216345_102606 [Cupriavidus sp. YR651]